jgi:PAS domain S-box-containing protein
MTDKRPFPTETARLQLLIDAVTEYAIYMLDPQGFVATWNSGAQKIKGYRETEIIGVHYSRFFTSEDRLAGEPARNLDEARRVGKFESEGWRVRKDGTRFFASIVLNAIRDEQGQLVGFAKITRDITKRVAAQQALLESERRFRILVEGVVDYAIYMLDLNGLVYNWNIGAERMQGYRAAEIVGQHFSKFYTDEDRAIGLPAKVLDIVRREGRYEAEGWRVRKDGSRFWASVVIDAIRDSTGELISFGKVTRDITERQAAQEALRESDRQFRLMVRSVTDYAIYMLDRNGIVTNWNAGAQRIKGYSADEIIGHHFSRFYTEQDRAAGHPARALDVARNEGRFEAEAWRLRKDGSLFWASVVIDPVLDDDGKLAGYAKITRDMTERREAQLALQKAQAQRSQMQKMEALGQLTGGIAHDFNNILMIVMGHLSKLKRLVGADPAGTRSAETIEMAAKRAGTLTRQLLSFSRRQSLNPEVIDLGEWIGSFTQMLSSSLGAAIKIVVRIAPTAWKVKIDLSEFELALVNIAINARDAMPDGGEVTIAVDNVRFEAKDSALGLEGEYVSVSVADTGSGIPPDIVPKVFDPFFTTKPFGKGTGLGLSQVYGFAHQSGGSVGIESELGRGTMFTLYLPRETAGAPRASDGPRAEFVDGAGGILLVEDNPEVAEISRSMLEQLGYKVEVAGDAQSALEMVERASGHIDLIISDIVMAGKMDGRALARTVRDQYPQLPVMLMTGYADAQVAGEFPVLRKPFELGELSRAAANAIAQHAKPPANLVDLREAKRGRTK